ncbi:hypothetical protein HanRHA438_Chr07g0301101 [Helianthus annuus]|nr:hypothetical protein HanRHA438_Chr07g0301101 [Helianthus annuus]
MAPTTHDPRARAEKRATRSKKKRSEDSGDETYMPSDTERPVKKASKRKKKSKVAMTVKKTGSLMTKKARKVIEEPVFETTTARAEPIVTEKSARVVEEKNVIPIKIPTASQQTPTNVTKNFCCGYGYSYGSKPNQTALCILLKSPA